MVPMCWGGVAGYGTHVLWWSGTHVLWWSSWLWYPYIWSCHVMCREGSIGGAGGAVAPSTEMVGGGGGHFPPN